MRAIHLVWGGLLVAACAPQTHLDQPPGELAVLELASGDTGCGASTAGSTFRRVFQDGTGSLQPFAMPAGRSLVITDLDWQYRHPDGAAEAGRRVTLRVFIQNLDDPDRRERVLESTIQLDAAGEGGDSESMTAGFVMSAAGQLCVDAAENPKGPPFGIQHAILRGYFVAP